MKKLVLLSLICYLASFTLTAQQVPITYFKPNQYKKMNAALKVKASIELEPKLANNGKIQAFFSDAVLEYSIEGNKLILWLPLIGEPNQLKIMSGKQLVANQMYQPLIPKDWGYFQNGTIHIISSSHQDVAWMNVPDSCRHERIHDIILPALKIMETDKAFSFGMEQSLNLMELLEEFPDKKSEVALRYKENRFAWGATYNQPYEGLESGEQLVRQAYYGRKWIRENIPGADDVTAYNIDVPGRTLQMPQIYAKSGIKNLFISRMREGLYDWSAPDGSKVFTFTPGNYGWAVMMWKFFDTDAIHAFSTIHNRSKLWTDYFKERNIPPHYAVVISNDAAGPSNYKVVVDEWNSIVDLAEVPLPRLQHSTAEAYFNQVNVPQAKKEQVSGERPNLWLYIHGPAHYQAIAAKRRAAIVLPAAEAFTAFNCMLDNNWDSYSRKAFDNAWMASIYPDHGWGGKNGAITDSIFRASLERSEREGKVLLSKALNQIANKVPTNNNAIVVFNDLSWERTAEAQILIDAQSAKSTIITDAKGKVMASQVRTANGQCKLVFMAENVPSMGYATFYKTIGKPAIVPSSSVKQLPNYYENQFYKISFADGGIAKWYDKQLNKELLNTTKFNAGDVLNLGYSGNGAGEFTQVTPLTPGDITTLSSKPTLWNIVESGPLFCVYQNKQQFKQAAVVQNIIVYHQIKRVDFDVSIENFDGTHGRQFRMVLPLNMKAGTINYEVPMAVLQVGRDEMQTRPGGWAWGGTYSQLPAETTPREIQNFISANGNNFGITMSSEVAVADWVDPSREAADYDMLQGILLSSHKSCHGEGNWYEQKGTHRYRFSVQSHQEGWENGYVFGMEANHPLLVVEKPNKTSGSLDLSMSFASTSTPFVVFNTIKKADNSNKLIMRVTEMSGKNSLPTISLFKPIKTSFQTNLIEDEIKQLNLTGASFQFDIRKYSVETLQLEF